MAYDLVITGETKNGEYTLKACPGGSVLNTTVALARLGVCTSLVSRVSKDFLTDSLIKMLLSEGVNVRHVQRASHLRTALAVARVSDEGESSYVFYSNPPSQTAVNCASGLISAFDKAHVLHTGSMFSYSEHSYESAFKLMKKAREKGMFTTYDPNWREDRVRSPGRAKKRVHNLFDIAGLIKLSDNDIFGITGARTFNEAVKKMPGKTVITMGSKGSLFWDGKKRVTCPSAPVKVVDTIGAGDAFTAGMIYRYCCLGKELFWEDMPANLEFASMIAGKVCSARGAVAGIGKMKRKDKSL